MNTSAVTLRLMPGKKPRTIPLVVRVSAKHHDNLRSLAYNERKSIAHFVRLALATFLDNRPRK